MIGVHPIAHGAHSLPQRSPYLDHSEGFALGCALSSVYGFLSGAWPFGVIEAIWAVIALRRYVG